MPKSKEAGFIQILIVALLLLGLGAGAYLVQRQTNLKSHASVGDSENSYSLVAYPKGGSAITEPQDSPSIAVKPGDQFTVDILVRTPTDEVNLFSAKLKFDKDLVQVAENGLEVGISNPFILRQKTEAVFNNDNGTISIVGGVPTPGYKSILKQSGLLAKMTFKAVKEGKTKIDFLADSEMYKNSDGSKLGLVIQRGLNVEISDNSSNQTQNSNQELQTVTYHLSRDSNQIGIPLDISITPEEFLNKTVGKCDYMVKMQEFGQTNSDGYSLKYKNDVAKYLNGNFRILTEVTGGSGYYVYCSDPVDVSLTGKPRSGLPTLKESQVNVILPYGYTKSAKEFLLDLDNADNRFNCGKVKGKDGKYDREDDIKNNFTMDYRSAYTIECNRSKTIQKPIVGICGLDVYGADVDFPTLSQAGNFHQACTNETNINEHNAICTKACPEGFRWPTKDELLCLGDNLDKLLLRKSNYYSSTEVDKDNFMIADFAKNKVSTTDKNRQLSGIFLRCVKTSNQPAQQTTSAAPVPSPSAAASSPATTTNTQTLSPIPRPSPTNKSTDINGDGKTDLSDLSRLLAKFNQKDNGSADLNNDGIVNTFDVLLLRQALIKQGVISGQ